MIRITLMDGTTQELPRENVKGVSPWRTPLTNPNIKSDGVIFHNGKLLPVHGPLAEVSSGSVDERAWFLVLGKHVQVIRGLPTFSDDLQLNIVPERTRSAPALAPVAIVEETTEEAPALEDFAAAPAPAPVVATAPARTEEDEEAQVLQELEDLLRAS